jgi:glutathione peroxidase-family protein
VLGGYLFTKADVNGPNTRVTYRFLKAKGIVEQEISWNFTGKFIVDREGNCKYYYQLQLYY